MATARQDGHLSIYEAKLMQEKILDFRAAMDGMYDYTDQPPHFFYIHFLVLLSALYLPLFSIDAVNGAGWGDETCECCKLVCRFKRPSVLTQLHYALILPTMYIIRSCF